MFTNRGYINKFNDKDSQQLHYSKNYNGYVTEHKALQNICL